MKYIPSVCKFGNCTFLCSIYGRHLLISERIRHSCYRDEHNLLEIILCPAMRCVVFSWESGLCRVCSKSEWRLLRFAFFEPENHTILRIFWPVWECNSSVSQSEWQFIEINEQVLKQNSTFTSLYKVLTWISNYLF